METRTSTRPIWFNDILLPELPQLTGRVKIDVAVIGGGITGLTCAALIKQAGRQVALIEGGEFCAAGATSGTSAHLTAVLDQSYPELIESFGEDSVRALVQAKLDAIDLIEELAGRFGFENDFRRLDGYQYTEDAAGVEEIEAEFDAARRLGLPVEMVPITPLPFPVRRAYRISGQGQFHPLKHAVGLAKAINDGRSQVYERSRAVEIEPGEPCVIRLENGATLEADNVFIATHSPIGIWMSLHTRLVPMLSYCLAARLRGAAPEGLFWDNADPYHYTRPFEPEDPSTIIVGGADTKTGAAEPTEQAFKRLEDYLRQRFDVESVEARWSAQFFEPADGLPYIGPGPLSPHIFVATGFSGNGMTYGTLAGSMVADQMLGRLSPWAELFNPSRIKPLSSGKVMLEEAMATLKGLVVDRVMGDEASVFSDIAAGEGRVMRIGGEQIAVHRDEHRQLHACSATCTHMGCIVAWNSAERRWDCPCHGSIFAADGSVMYGPATTPLAKMKIEGR
jgi:glycine/D-amino acid oxidase-like deaminating enzyme/nitrite reductase/ring-hydroxylating ferredoxin subunit